MITGLANAYPKLDSPKLESRIDTSNDPSPVLVDKPPVKPKAETSKTEDYIQAFIDNKMVRKVFPDAMNWINILGNSASLIAGFLGFSETPKKFAQAIGSLSTKAFLISTAVINIVERLYSKNFLSALGYLNDILVASFVGQDHLYLARGTASGTYNVANALCIANNKFKFSSIDEHLQHLGLGFGNFFKNLFSTNIVQNFANSKNAMFATIGGIFANIGAFTWIFSGEEKLATTIRDIAGVVMDVEQLNPGHLKSGYKNYFWSGVTLAIGTLCDWTAKIFPKHKDALVPLTFIIDGVGRHLLRLHQNQEEIEKQVSQLAKVDEKQSRRVMESLAQLAA
jgi:hypothetical protein